jgi:hypothetical protein
MVLPASEFLPGVPVDQVEAALIAAGGNEIDSGKFSSPESSAALAVNAFGWFISRPHDLPAFPGLADIGLPATRVDIERQMHFPWRGGRHPWLDAAVETPTHLIGVESKRFEPFRDKKKVELSDAYNRDVWGDGMEPFTRMRDALREIEVRFAHLDAAQLVKHAFGLVTEGRRTGKSPVLLYLYAEPAMRGAKSIAPELLLRHRAEITAFADLVSGGAVRFVACSYREWLAGWSGDAQQHAEMLVARFQP